MPTRRVREPNLIAIASRSPLADSVDREQPAFAACVLSREIRSGPAFLMANHLENAELRVGCSIRPRRAKRDGSLHAFMRAAKQYRSAWIQPSA